MLVLHAGVSDNSFLVWGEAPATSLDTPRPRRTARENGNGTAPRLPYDAGRARLREALQGSWPHGDPDEGAFRQVTGWLPTLGTRPCASSPLIADTPSSFSPPALRPWAVTALQFDTPRALALLCACVDKRVLRPGVIVGEDLSYWSAVMRFAAALTARQEFLPGLLHHDGRYFARWIPIIVEPEATRLRELARAMPGAARALTLDPDSPPPDAPALNLVGRVVNELVDHLARVAFHYSGPDTTSRPDSKPRGLDSVHDQWLFALRSLDAEVEGSPGQLEEFASQVGEWQRPIALPGSAPFRLCFRLEEPQDASINGQSPANGNESWYVRYVLQAVNDPSLIVPASSAWNAAGADKLLLSRNGFNVHECLLRSLGQAMAVCPEIETSLGMLCPEGHTLDTSGAHRFLMEQAAQLEQSGYGVMLPAWWTRKGTKLRLKARVRVQSPAMQAGSGILLDELLKFQWELALGEEKLTRDELTMLARLKSPLVKLRGQWVEMSAEEIQAARDFWNQKSSGEVRARDMLQAALGAAPRDVLPAGVAFEGVTATGWMGELLARLEDERRIEQQPAPGTFQGTLRPYQLRGYSWLEFMREWGLGACLADDMGLGKTVQALALVEQRRPNLPRPVLLICPTSVMGNWHKEAQRFTPALRILMHHGPGRVKGNGFAGKAAGCDLVISSYALLQRDLESLSEMDWSGVILDEAQNIKNPETKQAAAARALRADYRIALTGTPVENSIGDLWSIMEFLNPGLLGTRAEFKKKFFIPIQAYRDARAVERLKRLTGPFVLRRVKTDKSIIADLPEKMEMKVFCTLTREQASLYEAVVSETSRALESAEGIQRKGIVLATLSKLKQVCNHPAQFLGDNSGVAGRSGKLARLSEMLEEPAAVDDRALIFTQFWEMGDILQRYLQETFGREVLFLHGGVEKRRRDHMLERFQHEGGPSVFILSLKAGGTGLNLTRANHVFHFDRWWNPAVEDQATDRAFRIGQRRNVQIHKFLCLGTVEEKIDEMMERKRELAAGVVGSGEAWLTELSTAELKEILALRNGAVED